MRLIIYSLNTIYPGSLGLEDKMIEAPPTLEEAQARLLRTVAHPFRIQVLEVLSQEEECVCHLSALFDKPQPFVSQHLAALKEAGLVADRREGQRIFYRSADPRISNLLRTSQALAGGIETTSPPRGPVSGCKCPKCDPDAR